MSDLDPLEAAMRAAADTQCDVNGCMGPVAVETRTGRRLCGGCAYERRNL